MIWRVVILLLAVISTLMLGSCVSWFGGSSAYDSRVLTLQSLSLFNQRTKSQMTRDSWLGDWIFRRERLSLIDDELRHSKPDIVILQEMIHRDQSPSESDKAILSAGSLQGYFWQQEPVFEFEDTEEVQSLAVAASLPVRPYILPEQMRRSWTIGNDGYLQLAVVEFEEQPVVIFNVQMPPRFGRNFLWYTFIEERIMEVLSRDEFCAERIIIAGYMPTDQGSQRFLNFIERLQLKDSSVGFCQVASRCYTSSPTNELFMATAGAEVASQTDRILVHQSASLYSSGRNFDSATELDGQDYAKRFNLTRLHPTQRFGWQSSVRLARCQS